MTLATSRYLEQHSRRSFVSTFSVHAHGTYYLQRCVYMARMCGSSKNHIHRCHARGSSARRSGGKPARANVCCAPTTRSSGSCPISPHHGQLAHRRGEALLCHDGWPPLEAVVVVFAHVGRLCVVARVEEFGARCWEKVLSSDAWGEVVGESTALFFCYDSTQLCGGRGKERKRRRGRRLRLAVYSTVL